MLSYPVFLLQCRPVGIRYSLETMQMLCYESDDLELRSQTKAGVLFS